MAALEVGGELHVFGKPHIDVTGSGDITLLFCRKGVLMQTKCYYIQIFASSVYCGHSQFQKLFICTNVSGSINW